ncbi:FadR family transcriptional regulator [Mycolicibacterium boenickei]|nr:FadR family transcriptional regulator [Mycolicibacterium boenickei]
MPVNTQDRPERTDRAASVVARQLRRRIIRGELVEGELLPTEAQLIEQFGVSRPTLREAIRVLESESLVVVKRGSRGGIEVSIPRVQNAAHYAGLLLEYRRATTADVFVAAAAIEGPCVAMLARNRTAEDLEGLRNAIADERRLSEQPAALLEQQNDFHRVLIEMAGNQTLMVLSEVLRYIIEIATERYVNDPGLGGPDTLPSANAATRTHQKIVYLIESRDAQEAEALWRKHILATSNQLKKAGVANTVLDLLG